MWISAPVPHPCPESISITRPKGQTAQSPGVPLRAQSVVSDSLRPSGLEHTRLLCPWDSPGTNTGAGYQFLLQGIVPTQDLNLGSFQVLEVCLGDRLFTTEPPGKPLWLVPQWLSLLSLSIRHVILESLEFLARLVSGSECFSRS